MARFHRVKRVVVTPETLIALAKGGFAQGVEVVEHPLPADATYVDATYDPNAKAVYLFIESASFDLIPEGAIVPALPAPVFRVIVPVAPVAVVSKAPKARGKAKTAPEPH